MATRPRRRKDDIDLAVRADALIRNLDDLIRNLDLILIGEPVADSKD